MTQPKVGQRVKVSYEATVRALEPDRMWVRAPGASFCLLPPDAVVEVIPDPEPAEVTAVREAWMADSGASLETVASDEHWPHETVSHARAILTLIDQYERVLGEHRLQASPPPVGEHS